MQIRVSQKSKSFEFLFGKLTIAVNIYEKPPKKISALLMKTSGLAANFKFQFILQKKIDQIRLFFRKYIYFCFNFLPNMPI